MPHWDFASGQHEGFPQLHEYEPEAPRVFQDDTPEDKQAIQSVLPK
jgi:hypothetical protein